MFLRAKCDCGPDGGNWKPIHSASIDPLAKCFKRSLRGGEGERTKEEGRGEEGQKRRGSLTLMLSWNRASDWLRPALF